MSQPTSAKTVLSLQSSPQGYEAAYQECGTGEAVLFLHGFMGEGSCWRSLITELQPHYRCISLDMLGFGQSSTPLIRYDIAALVAFLRQFINALDLQSVTLVGHSLGGWVAAAYALAYPETVRALVLLAPAGIRDDSFCGRYDHLRPLLWQTPVIDWGLALLKPLARLIGQGEAIAQISWFRTQINAQPAGRSFLVDRLRPEDAIDTVEQEIHRLRVPTLVITGDRDETIPLWHSQTYASEIPGAQLSILPDADHALPQNYPVAVAAQIVPFLAAQRDLPQPSAFQPEPAQSDRSPAGSPPLDSSSIAL